MKKDESERKCQKKEGVEERQDKEKERERKENLEERDGTRKRDEKENGRERKEKSKERERRRKSEEKEKGLERKESSEERLTNKEGGTTKRTRGRENYRVRVSDLWLSKESNLIFNPQKAKYRQKNFNGN